jgi:thiol:disulfide interchange protein
MPSTTSTLWRRWGTFLVTLLAAAILATPAAGQDQVVVSAKPSKSAVFPGEQFAIAVVFDHQQGWHIHTNSPVVPRGLGNFYPVATEVALAPAPSLVQWPIQWPEPHEVMVSTGGPHVPYRVFDGRAVALIPVKLDEQAQAGQVLSLSIAVAYQACDDVNCLPPEDVELEIEIPVVAMGAPEALPGPLDADFARFDPSVFAQPPGAGEPPTTASAAVPYSTTDVGFGLRVTLTVPLVILFGLIGGFVLNLTPCVLPVIPLKVMGLSHAAAGSRRRCLFLGAMTSLGIVAFWLFIGFLIAGLQTLNAVSQLFANPWFAIGVGLFIAVMALGMMGLFAMQLPQWVYSVTPKHDTAAGSFLFGVMTAVLGTPCFGPFAGGAAGWATGQSTFVALAAFGALGVGMAIPYLLLAANPAWISKVPRTGPGSELVKQVMGLLLLAAAAYFVGAGMLGLIAEFPYLGPVIYWWFVAFFAVIAGAWLIYKTFHITRSRPKRWVFAMLGLFIVSVSVAWAQFQTHLAAKLYVPRQQTMTQSLWREYDPVAFDAAIREGKVVVIDFTAEWCLNCKVLEATVLARDDVERSLTHPGVVAFKADLTSRRAPGWAKLKDLGEVGIPLLAVFGPGLEQPWKSNAYTPDQVISAVERGGKAPGAPLAGR